MADEETEETVPYGNNTFYSTFFEYDLDGNQVAVISPNVVSTSGYDPAGRLIWTFNTSGITRYGYDPDGNQTSTTMGDPIVTQTVYDADNRPIETITGGSTTTTTYDAAGNVIESTDADDNKTSFTYNQSNELVVSDRCPGQPHAAISPIPTATAPNRSALRPNDNLGLQREQPGNIETLYAADGKTKTDIRSFAYDADGNRIAASNVAGSYFMA